MGPEFEQVQHDFSGRAFEIVDLAEPDLMREML